MVAQATLNSFGLMVIPQLMDLECINAFVAIALEQRT
jgi:hypothetical protein